MCGLVPEIYPLCFIPYEKIMNRSSSSSSLAAAAARTRTRTMVSEAPLLELPKRIKRIKGKEIWQKSSAVVCVLRRPG